MYMPIACFTCSFFVIRTVVAGRNLQSILEIENMCRVSSSLLCHYLLLVSTHLLAFYHECHSLANYTIHYLFYDRQCAAQQCALVNKMMAAALHFCSVHLRLCGVCEKKLTQHKKFSTCFLKDRLSSYQLCSFSFYEKIKAVFSFERTKYGGLQNVRPSYQLA